MVKAFYIFQIISLYIKNILWGINEYIAEGWQVWEIDKRPAKKGGVVNAKNNRIVECARKWMEKLEGFPPVEWRLKTAKPNSLTCKWKRHECIPFQLHKI
jgi:hypothetical protein